MTQFQFSLNERCYNVVLSIKSMEPQTESTSVSQGIGSREKRRPSVLLLYLELFLYCVSEIWSYLILKIVSDHN